MALLHLQKAAEVIGVEKPHTYYFGLYLEMKREEEDTWTGKDRGACVACIFFWYTNNVLYKIQGIRNCVYCMGGITFQDKVYLNTPHLETLQDIQTRAALVRRCISAPYGLWHSLSVYV